MTPGKTRQKAYRRRMQEGGCRQVTVWLNADAYTALQLLVASQQKDASTVTSDAIRHYHAVTSDKPAVTRNRYMSQALEDHILALRQSRLSLRATARQLADEGHKNAKGEPYNTSTVSKAEAHARHRVAPAACWQPWGHFELLHGTLAGHCQPKNGNNRQQSTITRLR